MRYEALVAGVWLVRYERHGFRERITILPSCHAAGVPTHDGQQHMNKSFTHIHDMQHTF